MKAITTMELEDLALHYVVDAHHFGQDKLFVRHTVEAFYQHGAAKFF